LCVKQFRVSEKTFEGHSKSLGDVFLRYITWTFYQRAEKQATLIFRQTAEMTLKVDHGRWRWHNSIGYMSLSASGL